MAVLDPQNDEVVIRIVYDGPPLAGKTTSVAVLARRLGGQMVTPDEKVGRTVFFDWLEYRGGLFEGRQIRCQIISVPGQATLAPRRRRLVESADVVVFVCDSTPEAFQSSRGYLTGLSSALANLDPPVGILIQANKRDHPDAAPIEELRRVVDDLSMQVGIVESVAPEGIGIRETFVFAVRLALDRVRELIRTDQLRHTKPAIDSAEDLLAELQQAEAGAMSLAVDSGLTHTRLNELMPSTEPATLSSPPPVLEQAISDDVTPTDVIVHIPDADVTTTAPIPPGKDIPGGMIWPPVNGRMILHELASTEITLQQLPGGDWYGVASERWQLHSASNAIFRELEQGRTALLRWARLHTASASLFSPHRCLVLAEDGHGQYRLWQIVAREKSIYDELTSALTASAEEMVATLLATIRWFLQALERCSGNTCNLALNLNNVGVANNNAIYLGLAPDPLRDLPTVTYTDASVLELLSKELDFIMPVVRHRREEILRAFAQYQETHHNLRSDLSWQFLQRLFNIASTKAMVPIQQGASLISIVDRILFEQPLDQIYRISHSGFKPIHVVPNQQTYYLDAPLTILKELASSAELKTDILPLPETTDHYLPGVSKPLAILCWAAGMYSSEEKLLPWLDPETSFRLKQWPNFNNLEFEPDTLHMNLATLLFKGPFTIAQLQQETELPLGVVHSFINACALCHYLDMDGDQKNYHEREMLLLPPKPATGLIARIRKRLGI